MSCARDFCEREDGERAAPRLLILFDPLILFHGFRGNSGRSFGAVAYLRVGRGRADRAPRLATRHPRAHCNANKHR